MRDKHDVLSMSTSPPPKKHKISTNESPNVDEDVMDVDERNENELEKLDTNAQEAEEKLRSKLMDEKVESKAKKIEEEETLFKRKQDMKILENKILEEAKKENEIQLNKQRKQKSKDARKRINKIKSVKENIEKPKNDLPNIKPVPKNLAHLVKKGDKIYTVPGDGACGPNSASAFLFKDEVFGPQLKRNMNRFMARHWEKKYQLDAMF